MSEKEREEEKTRNGRASQTLKRRKKVSPGRDSVDKLTEIRTRNRGNAGRTERVKKENVL